MLTYIKTKEIMGNMGEEVFKLKSNGTKFTFHNEDCIQGMKDWLVPGTVDLIVTSPPYNLGVKYKKYKDNIARKEYLDWLDQWAQSVVGVMHDGSSLFLNIAGKPSDPWVPFDVLGVMRNHFVLQNVIHWIKSISIQKKDVGNYPGITQDVSIGHFKPLQGQRFLNDCHEYIFHLTKTGDVKLDRLGVGVKYQDKSNIKRWKSPRKDLRCRGNTWFAPYRTIRSRDAQRPHPATFPAQIPEMCMRLHGLENIQLALDPFLGIGHSALACLETKTNFIGFEIDPDYYKTSCEIITDAANLKESEIDL